MPRSERSPWANRRILSASGEGRPRTTLGAPIPARSRCRRSTKTERAEARDGRNRPSRRCRESPRTARRRPRTPDAIAFAVVRRTIGPVPECFAHGRSRWENSVSARLADGEPKRDSMESIRCAVVHGEAAGGATKAGHVRRRRRHRRMLDQRIGCRSRRMPGSAAASSPRIHRSPPASSTLPCRRIAT